MTSFVRFLGAAALGGLLVTPAAAQYNPYPTQPGYNYPAYPGQQYPQQTYPQQTYPGYGYSQGYGQGYGQNPVGDIIDQLLGNRYSVTDRQAVRQCANAARAQAAARYGGGYGGGGYNGYNQGYGGYSQGYGNARVTAITSVERRSYGIRVSGTMSTSGYGGYGNQGYGYSNPSYGARQLSFRCNVDYRGTVTGVRVRAAGGY